MPHFIVECSDGARPEVDTQAFAQEMHKVAVDSGLFNEKAIKVRVVPCVTSLVAGEPQEFVHVTIYLIDGRDKATKKQLATSVHDMIRDKGLSLASVSVDVRDLDREIYTKSQI